MSGASLFLQSLVGLLLESSLSLSNNIVPSISPIRDSKKVANTVAHTE